MVKIHLSHFDIKIVFQLTFYSEINNFSLLLIWNHNKSCLFENISGKKSEKSSFKFFLTVHFRVFFSRFLSHFVQYLKKYKRYLNNFNGYELARHEAKI
jgi:hypothetical protein